MKKQLFYILIFSTLNIFTSGSKGNPPYRDTRSSILRKTAPSKAQIFEEQASSYQKSAHRLNVTLKNLNPQPTPKKLSRTSTASSNYLPSEARSRSNRSMSLNDAPNYPIIAEALLKNCVSVPTVQGFIPQQHHCPKKAYKF